MRSGAITADEINSHPLRNAVSRCMGGARKLPKISFDEATLQPDDTLLLCSDGLWSTLAEDRLQQIPIYGDLEQAVNRLTDEAQMIGYPHCDNISLVGLRWLALDADDAVERPGKRAPAGRKPARPRKTAAPADKDPVKQAIDDIHRAMLDYAAEMKK